MTILSVNISDNAISTVKDVKCRCIIHVISKYEAISLIKDNVLDDGVYIKKILSEFWFGVVNLKNGKHLKKYNRIIN